MGPFLRAFPSIAWLGALLPVCREGTRSLCGPSPSLSGACPPVSRAARSPPCQPSSAIPLPRGLLRLERPQVPFRLGGGCLPQPSRVPKDLSRPPEILARLLLFPPRLGGLDRRAHSFSHLVLTEDLPCARECATPWGTTVRSRLHGVDSANPAPPAASPWASLRDSRWAQPGYRLPPRWTAELLEGTAQVCPVSPSLQCWVRSGFFITKRMNERDRTDTRIHVRRGRGGLRQRQGSPSQASESLVQGPLTPLCPPASRSGSRGWGRTAGGPS